ncbi:hypothetical protein IW147_005968 [Coemansia sp. RSA 720]|nr:hypothetical protein IW147_005968 [Coemansia sp. RSA 720]
MERDRNLAEQEVLEAERLFRTRRTRYASLRDEQEGQEEQVADIGRINVLKRYMARNTLRNIGKRVEMAHRDLEEARNDLEAAADRQAAAADRQATVVAAAETSYNQAKAEYRMAMMDAATVPAQQPNIFAALTLSAQDMATSTHINETTRYVFKYIPVMEFTEGICRFQDECLENPVVARFVAQDTSVLPDRLESGFADCIINNIGPRVKEILLNVVGVRRFEINKLAPNFGVDLEVLVYRPFDIQPAVVLPIKVQGFIGKMLGTPPGIGLEGLDQNIDALRDICAEVAGEHNIVNLNHALSQTATYIEQNHSSHNRGVMFAKDCVVLLWRTNCNIVLVSHVIGYQSTRPHPAAAIAYWIREALFNPTEVIRLDTTESGGVQAAGHSGDSRIEANV